MTATPCFRKQTYYQVKKIQEEFKPPSWENAWQYLEPRAFLFDVYIYENKLYTKISD